MRLCLPILALLSFGLPAAKSDVRNCVCELTQPEIATVRACSLCVEADKHPASEPYFLLKDSNPTKPNRWLALPRAPLDGSSPLAKMSAEERLALWTLAVNKAKELWGDSWGVAMNGDVSRSQCHLHLHIGKLLENQEPENSPDSKRSVGVYITSLAELPAIADGTGLWLHPEGNRFHLHLGEQATETVLVR
jgi:hypothetical protein